MKKTIALFAALLLISMWGRAQENRIYNQVFNGKDISIKKYPNGDLLILEETKGRAIDTILHSKLFFIEAISEVKYEENKFLMIYATQASWGFWTASKKDGKWGNYFGEGILSQSPPYPNRSIKVIDINKIIATEKDDKITIQIDYLKKSSNRTVDKL